MQVIVVAESEFEVHLTLQGHPEVISSSSGRQTEEKR